MTVEVDKKEHKEPTTGSDSKYDLLAIRAKSDFEPQVALDEKKRDRSSHIRSLEAKISRDNAGFDFESTRKLIELKVSDSHRVPKKRAEQLIALGAEVKSARAQFLSETFENAGSAKVGSIEEFLTNCLSMIGYDPTGNATYETEVQDVKRLRTMRENLHSGEELSLESLHDNIRTLMVLDPRMIERGILNRRKEMLSLEHGGVTARRTALALQQIAAGIAPNLSIKIDKKWRQSCDLYTAYLRLVKASNEIAALGDQKEGFTLATLSLVVEKLIEAEVNYCAILQRSGGLPIEELRKKIIASREFCKELRKKVRAASDQKSYAGVVSFFRDHSRYKDYTKELSKRNKLIKAGKDSKVFCQQVMLDLKEADESLEAKKKELIHIQQMLGDFYALTNSSIRQGDKKIRLQRQAIISELKKFIKVSELTDLSNTDLSNENFHIYAVRLIGSVREVTKSSSRRIAEDYKFCLQEEKALTVFYERTKQERERLIKWQRAHNVWLDSYCGELEMKRPGPAPEPYEFEYQCQDEKERKYGHAALIALCGDVCPKIKETLTNNLNAFKGFELLVKSKKFLQLVSLRPGQMLNLSDGIELCTSVVQQTCVWAERGGTHGDGWNALIAWFIRLFYSIVKSVPVSAKLMMQTDADRVKKNLWDLRFTLFEAMLFFLKGVEVQKDLTRININKQIESAFTQFASDFFEQKENSHSGNSVTFPMMVQMYANIRNAYLEVKKELSRVRDKDNKSVVPGRRRMLEREFRRLEKIYHSFKELKLFNVSKLFGEQYCIDVMSADCEESDSKKIPVPASVVFFCNNCAEEAQQGGQLDATIALAKPFDAIDRETGSAPTLVTFEKLGSQALTDLNSALQKKHIDQTQHSALVAKVKRAYNIINTKATSIVADLDRDIAAESKNVFSDEKKSGSLERKSTDLTGSLERKSTDSTRNTERQALCVNYVRRVYIKCLFKAKAGLRALKFQAACDSKSQPISDSKIVTDAQSETVKVIAKQILIALEKGTVSSVPEIRQRISVLLNLLSSYDSPTAKENVTLLKKLFSMMICSSDAVYPDSKASCNELYSDLESSFGEQNGKQAIATMVGRNLCDGFEDGLINGLAKFIVTLAADPELVSIKNYVDSKKQGIVNDFNTYYYVILKEIILDKPNSTADDVRRTFRTIGEEISLSSDEKSMRKAFTFNFENMLTLVKKVKFISLYSTQSKEKLKRLKFKVKIFLQKHGVNIANNNSVAMTYLIFFAMLCNSNEQAELSTFIDALISKALYDEYSLDSKTPFFSTEELLEKLKLIACYNPSSQHTFWKSLNDILKRRCGAPFCNTQSFLDDPLVASKLFPSLVFCYGSDEVVKQYIEKLFSSAYQQYTSQNHTFSFQLREFQKLLTKLGEFSRLGHRTEANIIGVARPQIVKLLNSMFSTVSRSNRPENLSNGLTNIVQLLTGSLRFHQHPKEAVRSIIDDSLFGNQQATILVAFLPKLFVSIDKCQVGFTCLQSLIITLQQQCGFDSTKVCQVFFEKTYAFQSNEACPNINLVGHIKQMLINGLTQENTSAEEVLSLIEKLHNILKHTIGANRQSLLQEFFNDPMLKVLFIQIYEDQFLIAGKRKACLSKFTNLLHSVFYDKKPSAQVFVKNKLTKIANGYFDKELKESKSIHAAVQSQKTWLVMQYDQDEKRRAAFDSKIRAGNFSYFVKDIAKGEWTLAVDKYDFYRLSIEFGQDKLNKFIDALDKYKCSISLPAAKYCLLTLINNSDIDEFLSNTEGTESRAKLQKFLVFCKSVVATESLDEKNQSFLDEVETILLTRKSHEHKSSRSNTAELYVEKLEERQDYNDTLSKLVLIRTKECFKHMCFHSSTEATPEKFTENLDQVILNRKSFAAQMGEQESKSTSNVVASLDVILSDLETIKDNRKLVRADIPLIKTAVRTLTDSGQITKSFTSQDSKHFGSKLVAAINHCPTVDLIDIFNEVELALELLSYDHPSYSFLLVLEKLLKQQISYNNNPSRSCPEFKRIPDEDRKKIVCYHYVYDLDGLLTKIKGGNAKIAELTDREAEALSQLLDNNYFQRNAQFLRSTLKPHLWKLTAAEFGPCVDVLFGSAMCQSWGKYVGIGVELNEILKQFALSVASDLEESKTPQSRFKISDLNRHYPAINDLFTEIEKNCNLAFKQGYQANESSRILLVSLMLTDPNVYFALKQNYPISVELLSPKVEKACEMVFKDSISTSSWPSTVMFAQNDPIQTLKNILRCYVEANQADIKTNQADIRTIAMRMVRAFLFNPKRLKQALIEFIRDRISNQNFAEEISNLYLLLIDSAGGAPEGVKVVQKQFSQILKSLDVDTKIEQSKIVTVVNSIKVKSQQATDHSFEDNLGGEVKQCDNYRTLFGALIAGCDSKGREIYRIVGALSQQRVEAADRYTKLVEFAEGLPYLSAQRLLARLDDIVDQNQLDVDYKHAAVMALMRLIVNKQPNLKKDNPRLAEEQYAFSSHDEEVLKNVFNLTQLEGAVHSCAIDPQSFRPSNNDWSGITDCLVNSGLLVKYMPQITETCPFAFSKFKHQGTWGAIFEAWLSRDRSLLFSEWQKFSELCGVFDEKTYTNDRKLGEAGDKVLQFVDQKLKQAARQIVTTKATEFLLTKDDRNLPNPNTLSLITCRDVRRKVRGPFNLEKVLAAKYEKKGTERGGVLIYLLTEYLNKRLSDNQLAEILSLTYLDFGITVKAMEKLIEQYYAYPRMDEFFDLLNKVWCAGDFSQTTAPNLFIENKLCKKDARLSQKTLYEKLYSKYKLRRTIYQRMYPQETSAWQDFKESAKTVVKHLVASINIDEELNSFVSRQPLPVFYNALSSSIGSIEEESKPLNETQKRCAVALLNNVSEQCSPEESNVLFCVIFRRIDHPKTRELVQALYSMSQVMYREQKGGRATQTLLKELSTEVAHAQELIDLLASSNVDTYKRGKLRALTRTVEVLRKKMVTTTRGKKIFNMILNRIAKAQYVRMISNAREPNTASPHYRRQNQCIWLALLHRCYVGIEEPLLVTEVCENLLYQTRRKPQSREILDLNDIYEGIEDLQVTDQKTMLERKAKVRTDSKSEREEESYFQVLEKRYGSSIIPNRWSEAADCVLDLEQMVFDKLLANGKLTEFLTAMGEEGQTQIKNLQFLKSCGFDHKFQLHLNALNKMGIYIQKLGGGQSDRKRASSVSSSSRRSPLLAPATSMRHRAPASPYTVTVANPDALREFKSALAHKQQQQQQPAQAMLSS